MSWYLSPKLKLSTKQEVKAVVLNMNCQVGDMVLSDSPPISKIPLERDDHGLPRFQGCANIRDFEFLGKLGEGTFGYAHYSVTFPKAGC